MALRGSCFCVKERTIIAAMSDIVSDVRASAGRVAKWLVDKGHPDEAVAILCAWAAQGPNDIEGQTLLADALRIDPAAKVAQHAFEKMEGIAGDHEDLHAAIAKYSESELSRLETEMRRPSFRRALMGFNNNIKFRDQVFHVQTEDSGLDQPHIVTHLFADGGRVIKSHKRSYIGEVNRPDVSEYVRGLMKAQHLEMVAMLRDGRFDAILEGREIGGIHVLTDLPNVDVRKLASQKKARAEAPSLVAVPPIAQAEPARVPEPKVQERFFTLHVLRCLAAGPAR